MNILQKPETGFAQIKNEVLFDTEISMKAKGLFAYLYAKPDEWDFSGDRIASDMKEGRGAVYSTLKELENAGYLYRDKQKNGRCIYSLNWDKKPLAQMREQGTKPVAENCKLQKLQVAETVSIINKDKAEKQKKNIKTIATANADAENVNKVLEAFQMKLNPNINYGNRTNRKACTDLINKMGMDRLMGLIDYCVDISSDKFAPIITTPYQLQEKSAQIAVHWQRNHNKTPNVISI